MGLTWMPVVIAGCLAMAVCVAAALLRPVPDARRRRRPLANAARLTRLPEYVRAARARTRSTVIAIALLVVIFVGSITAAARPTGWPTSGTESKGDPQDIMLCIGSPPTDPAVRAVLGEIADQVGTFGTGRIGMTSSNRRVIPLTRDYQYAKATLLDYADSDARRTDLASFSPTVSYADYAESLPDLLALCLTGFPDLTSVAGVRRSLIYVGPDTLSSPGETRPGLLTADRVRELAVAAGVQVNSVVQNGDSNTLESFARDTGGLSLAADTDVTAHLRQIRGNAPAATFSGGDRGRTGAAESPDVPLVVALLAAVGLVVWPVVKRR